MKVITICGSLKYQNEMMALAEKLSLEGNCVLTPIWPVRKKLKKIDEIENLKKSHFKRIDFSDAIFVANISNYIGESTKSEIEYAKKLNKEIIYMEE